MRLEDRQVLSASTLPVGDLGSLLSDAADTNLGSDAGSFSHDEAIGSDTDIDLYSLRGEAGSRLIVTTSGEQGTGTTLRLFDQLGNELATAPGGDLNGQSRLDVTLASSGTFYIGVSGAGNDAYNPMNGRGTVAGATGDYEINALLVVDSGVTGDPGTTLIDGFIGDAGLGHEIDLYRFEAQAGTTLTARTSLPEGATDQTNTFLRLFDANGNQLTFDDDSGAGLYSQVEYTFSSSGTYLVGVSAFPNIYYDPGDATGTFEGDTGEYRLSLNFDAGNTLATAAETGLAGASAQPFSAIETLGGGTAGNADVDLFRFEANAGDELTAQTFAVAGSPSPDTFLRLFDANGEEIAFDDDGGSAFLSRIDFTIATAGTYYLGVSGFPNTIYDPVSGADAEAGETGDYRVQIALSGAPATVSGTVFRDQDGDGEFDAGEPGQAGVLVFADANGNGQFDGTVTFSSTDVPLAIPDAVFDVATPVTSEIIVAGLAGAIADVNVTVNISHTFNDDLDLILISPDGTRIALALHDPAFVASDLFGENVEDATFDDEASTGIFFGSPPYTNESFQPNQPLSGLDGGILNGTWRLEVADNFDIDTGTLNSWSLTLTTDTLSVGQSEQHAFTDADGNYTLTDLQAGTHTIAQIPPSDHIQTFPPAAAPQTVTVGPGEDVQGINFGNQPIIGEIQGTKFEDVNEDGLRNPGEPGIAGVTIFLDENGNGLFDGAFEFDSADVPVFIPDLQTITSTIDISGVAGDITDLNLTLDVSHQFVEDLDLFLISPDGTRVALALGSNGDIFGTDLAGTTFDDEALQSITFAFPPYSGSFRPVGSLAAFDGADPNGTWTLEIADTFFEDDGFLNSWSLAISTDEVELSTVTDADGNYAFTGLQPGTYVVREVPQLNFVQTFPAGDGSHTVNLAQGEVVTGVDFGNRFGFAEIQGTVFEDVDGDGFQGTGELGIGDALVFVDLNGNGFLDALPSEFTSSDVPAPISDLTTTVSTLNVSGLNGLITDVNVTLDVTHSFNGDLEIFLVSPTGTAIALTFADDLFGANLVNTTFDDEAFDSLFFASPPYSGSFQPSGFLGFLDGEDANGEWRLEISDTFEFDEGVLNGWSLSITTTQPDNFEPFAFTDSSGGYTIGGIAAGTHTILQQPPVGFRQVSAFDFSQQVTLAVDEQRLGIDFGNQQTGTVTGIKFEDANANGIQDSGEPGLGGFLIQAFDAFGGFAGQTFTDFDGRFTLELLPGTYTIEEVQQPGFEQTTPGVLPVAGFQFENGAQGFVATGEWHLSTGRGSDFGHSSSTSFYFGSGESAFGGGQYASGSFGTLVSPLITLPEGQPATLTFNHLLDVELFFDNASVTVLSEGGATRTLIADVNTFGNLPDFTFGFFQTVELGLSDFAGQSIQIEFAFQSDESVEFEGWYVDDVLVTSGAFVHKVDVFAGQGVGGIDFGNRDLDVVGDDFQTAAPLGLVANGTVSTINAIDRFGDVDVFQVVAPQTGFLAVRMAGFGESGGFLDSFVEVFDEFGNLLTFDDDAGGFPDSLAAFEAVQGQRFFITASDVFSGGFGDYELSVTSTGPAQPLTLNQGAPGQFSGSVVGAIADPDQVQVIEVTVPVNLPAGSELTLTLDAIGSGNLEPSLLVFDSAGVLVYSDALFGRENSEFTTRVFGGETFLAVALGVDGTVGGFNLSATIDQLADDFGNDLETATNLGTLAAGTPLVQSGSIEDAFDVDAFLIQAPAGQTGTITIDLQAPDPVFGLDPILEVIDPVTGATIAFNDDVDLFNFNFDSQVTVSGAGQQFLVLARGFSSSVGEYTLTATFEAINDDFGNTPADAQSLGTVDVEADGTLLVQPGEIDLPGDVDVFRVEIVGGGTLEITQNATPGFDEQPLDPFVRVFEHLRDAQGDLLFDANGNPVTALLASNDDVGFLDLGNGQFTFSLNSLVSIEVADEDVLFVQAGAFGSSVGAYELAFAVRDDFPNDLPNASFFALPTAGTTVGGSIESAGDSDVFRFVAGEDARLSIGLSGQADEAGAAFNPLLTVFQEFADGKFREVARDGDVNRLASQIDLIVQAGDEYVVRVAEFGTDTGTYDLSVTPTVGAADIGNTFADAELIFNPALANFGLDPALFEITAGDTDVFRFVAQTTGRATFAAAGNGGLNAQVAAFEFIADPGNADNLIPQQIASSGAGGATVTFAVTAGQQFAVRISGSELTTGTYAPQLTVSANGGGSFTPIGTAGGFVFNDVRQALLTLSSSVTDRTQLADRLIRTAVNTFTSSTSFNPNQQYLILVLDPVDSVLSEGPGGPQVGFNGGQGQINEVNGSFFSGDGVVEVLILPTSAQSFNLNLAGLGADFLFEARLLTPGGPEGGTAANVTTSTGSQFDSGAFNQSLLGSLSLVLDFTGQGPGGGAGGAGGPGDVGLTFALNGQGQGNGVNGFGNGLNADGLALSSEAAAAIQQLQQAAGLDPAAGGSASEGWDRLWETVQIGQRYVRGVLASVDEWVADSVGVPSGLESVVDGSLDLLSDDLEQLLKKRQWVWSALGNQSPATPLKLFFQMRDAVERFTPALLRAMDAAPAQDAPAGETDTPNESADLPTDAAPAVSESLPDEDHAGSTDAFEASVVQTAAAVSDDRPATRLLRARPRLTRLFR